MLDSFGYIKAVNGETEFSHIPDWYDWERNEVKKEILNGSYRLEDDVRIFTMADYKAIYDIGEGHLIHDENGFSLKGFENSLDYTQSPPCLLQSLRRLLLV